MNTGNTKAQVLADTLDAATAKFLLENKSPSRKVNELDNRGSHFYLTLYWAQELASQDKDADLKAKFVSIAEQLTANESLIVKELNDAQGVAMDIQGYFQPSEELASKAMRPSATFNEVIAQIA